ncbi:hypothetical protein CDAR_607831 [Caerostris darwini]|uniref:Uncharacterized protein n=1 Tax=Caerostris darwini TaxID=1538125 RepID=A0AAV4UL57_9ARAC|nr:hypothetical protein CDAR_607831 [Caerostris darwini]
MDCTLNFNVHLTGELNKTNGLKLRRNCNTFGRPLPAPFSRNSCLYLTRRMVVEECNLNFFPQQTKPGIKRRHSSVLESVRGARRLMPRSSPCQFGSGTLHRLAIYGGRR